MHRARFCRCGHSDLSHRQGRESGCTLCDCPRFRLRRDRSFWRRLARWFRTGGYA